jgi:hypothetical protein
VEENDYGACGLADDLVDQSKRVLRALSEPNEGDVRSFSGGDGTDVFDVYFACDYFVAEGDDDRCDEREAVFALVSDKDT